MSIAETITSEVDVDMAHRFLQLVDANDTFTFQTFHDRPKGAEEDRTLARVIPGPAGKELFSLHDRGAGIYFTVNRTDGAGRKSGNITNIRAVWQEDDDGVAVDFPSSHRSSLKVRRGASIATGCWQNHGRQTSVVAPIMQR